jgi:gamma-glutamylcyclotransferase
VLRASMKAIYCVAYGSNLHPVRMIERVASAQALGVVDLPMHRLTFHKRSKDGSGKAMLTSDAGSRAYGVLYAFDSIHKAELDRLEGKGNGYNEQQVHVPFNGVDYVAYVYSVASTHLDLNLRPYSWYRDLVVAGATFHNMPEQYVLDISNVVAIVDPDEDRRGQNETLLQRIGWPPPAPR